jgi:predicted O-methyltransferase YrrM
MIQQAATHVIAPLWSSTTAGPRFGGLLASSRQLVRTLKWRRFRTDPWACVLRRLGAAPAATDWRAVLRGTAGWPPEVQAALRQIPDGFVSDWSFASDSGLWLYHHVRNSSYRTLLECGSGLSTVLMGLALRDRARSCGPARFYSLEHDEGWLQETQWLLRRLRLDRWVELIHAPLQRTVTHEGLLFTYDVSMVPPRDIDFVLIDGPPGQVGRADVVRRIHGRLSPHAVVVLDDAARRSEQQCCDAWTGGGYLQLRGFAPLGHGLAIFRRGPEICD